MWRDCVRTTGANSGGTHPSTIVRLPDTSDEAKTLLSTSTQQSMGIRYIRNEMIMAYAAAGGANVFHVGGLPGAGKTTTVKELIAELDDYRLIDSNQGDILLCSKSNSAKSSLMRACEGKTANLFPYRSFATLNSGFCIPVVHSTAEVTEQLITEFANRLIMKIKDGSLSGLQFLAVDEYTMSSCRELVYLDALLRMIKFRPDIPFGGVFVILLGDNRQNSAVVEDGGAAGVKGKKKPASVPMSRIHTPYRLNAAASDGMALLERREIEDGDENDDEVRDKEKDENEEPSDDRTFRTGGVEEDVDYPPTTNLYTDVLMKILQAFSSKDAFGASGRLRQALRCRLERLKKREQCVSLINDDTIHSYEKELRDARERDTLIGEGDANKASPSPAESVDGPHADAFSDDDDWLFADASLLKFVEGMGEAKDMEDTSAFEAPENNNFATRCRKIAEANKWFKGGDDREKSVSTTLELLKGTTAYALVEEGLRSEIGHLERLRKMKDDALVNYASYMFRRIISMAATAMSEIDYTGREKLYVVSSLAERFKDVHVMSLLNEEILNAKLLYGRDPHCTDAFPFRNQDNRTKAISACVRNAFLRDGCDIKGETPIVQYFNENLENLAGFLVGDSIAYADLEKKALEIKYVLENKEGPVTGTASLASPVDRGNEIDANDYDAGDGEDRGYCLDDSGCDDDNWGDMEMDDVQKLLSREDAPHEIGIDSTTYDRVGAMVAFHQRWYKWLAGWTECDTTPSDLVRTRLWHLYALVRMQQARFSDNAVDLPKSFDEAATSCCLFFPDPTDGKEYHEEFWVRALSMPVTVGGGGVDNNQQRALLLPAYSSHLSAVSRTFIMSSLKRIGVHLHAYAFMYGISLFDMTVNIRELIDSREIPAFSTPIGFKDSFSVEHYFDGIFKSITQEYLVLQEEDVLMEAKDVERVKGGLSVFFVRNLVSSKFGGNTKKSINLAMSMLSSISKGNMMSNKRKNEMRLEDAKRQKMEHTGFAERLADSISNTSTELRRDEAGDRMMGAIALTRSHAQKNAISVLVDRTIIGQAVCRKMSRGVNSIKHARSDVQLVIHNVDLSHIDHDALIGHSDIAKIMDGMAKSRARGKFLIDRFTDDKLCLNRHSPREFTKTLLAIKNKVTKARSIDLFQGQNVIFTSTNIRPYIHGSIEKFFVKDTGVVTDLTVKDGSLVVSVLVERLGGEAIQLCEGTHYLGNNYGDRYRDNRNAYVKYLPLESSHAMTIYSCQGQTIGRDTIVDLSGASTQDAYVAVTRNTDLKNLYVLQSSETDRRNLSNIKCSMGRDRSSLFPVGGIRTLNGDDLINHEAVKVAKDNIVKDMAVERDGGTEQNYSFLNPTKDMVSAAHTFVMSRSGNVLAFNSAWMSKTSNILKRDGSLDLEFERINRFFFGDGPDAAAAAEYHASASNSCLMSLFTAVSRSVMHYAMTGHLIRNPSIGMLEEHIQKMKDKKNYVKVHPVFLNRPPKEETIKALFYDVAPHSNTVMVMQAYAHYLFLVFEQLHICNSSFAFLPSAAPVVNEFTRPALKDTHTPPVAYAANVPGGLGYASAKFLEANDGGLRDLRRTITEIDDLGDNLDKIRAQALENCPEYDPDIAKSCTGALTRAMRCNLRRVGKYCKPDETCGLSTHGAVVVATDASKQELSHVHESKEEGYVSLSSEANMYGLLIFMTKLAGASGVSITQLDADAPNKLTANEGVFFGGYRVRLSNEVLWCGKCVPMKRVQFALHCKKIAAAASLKVTDRKLFGIEFEKSVLKQAKLGTTATVLVITEMLGHKFGEHSTSDIRSSVLTGVGNVAGFKKFNAQPGGGSTLITRIEEFLMRRLEKADMERVCFFVSAEYE